MSLNKTNIPWCDYTWNPITGCTPISEGCQNCYARAIDHRFNRSSTPTVHPDRFGDPLKLKTPSKIFVCSMGDFFHEDIVDNVRFFVIATMNRVIFHSFIILTKRIKEARRFWKKEFLDNHYSIPRNIWLGVTAENQARWDERVPILMSIPAAVRFVSVEPMLEPIEMHGLKPDWVICGPENGPGKRPCEDQWIKDLWFQCINRYIPFFDKRSNFHIRQFPKEAGR